jgi:hypothetical protein
MEIIKIIDAIFSSLTNITAAAVITILTLLALFGLFKSDNSQIKHFAKQSPAILATVGIFFSFWGISIGLIGLDLNDIQSSIPKLLDGLKIKFIASLMGIGASIVIRIAQSFDVKESVVDDYSAAILQELKLQNEILSLTNTNNKEHFELLNYSINSGFKNQIQRFDEFAESVTKNGTEALIQALQEVMRDFNNKINEQFGDNFKQLNQAVGALLIWQENYKKWQEDYKEDVIALKDDFQKAKNGISEIEISFKKIQTQAQNFTNISLKMGENIDLLEKHINKIDNFTSNSTTMFEDLNKLLKASNDEIEKRSSRLNLDQVEAQAKMSNLLQEMASSFTSVSTHFKDDYQNITKLMKDLNDQLIEKGR